MTNVFHLSLVLPHHQGRYRVLDRDEAVALRDQIQTAILDKQPVRFVHEGTDVFYAPGVVLGVALDDAEAQFEHQVAGQRAEVAMAKRYEEAMKEIEPESETGFGR